MTLQIHRARVRGLLVEDDIEKRGLSCAIRAH